MVTLSIYIFPQADAWPKKLSFKSWALLVYNNFFICFDCEVDNCKIWL